MERFTLSLDGELARASGAPTACGVGRGQCHPLPVEIDPPHAHRYRPARPGNPDGGSPHVQHRPSR